MAWQLQDTVLFLFDHDDLVNAMLLATDAYPIFSNQAGVHSTLQQPRTCRMRRQVTPERFADFAARHVFEPKLAYLHLAARKLSMWCCCHNPAFRLFCH